MEANVTHTHPNLQCVGNKVCVSVAGDAVVFYPLWMAARGSLLFFVLIIRAEKPRNHMLMPKQRRYTAL